PPEPLRHSPFADPQCCETGDQPTDDTADEAGADEHGHRTGGEPGCDSRPVGDRKRDVAGECGDQEAEGETAEAEQHRAEVLREAAWWQVPQRVLKGVHVPERLRTAVGLVRDLPT